MEFSSLAASETGVNYAAFNQNSTCFVIATKKGFVVNSTQKKYEILKKDENGCGRSIAEMIYDSALIILVGTGEDSSVSQRKISLYNMTTDQVIGSFNFVTAVLAVRANKNCVVVALESTTFVYNTATMAKIGEIPGRNPSGICALSPGAGAVGIVALPDEKDEGKINIYDCLKAIVKKREIGAHAGAVSAIAVSADGQYVASASLRGTVIRVYDVSTGAEVNSFRRGSQVAAVSSLSFSQDSSLLCVSSDHPTIHIFRMCDRPPPEEEKGYLSQYMPTIISRVWEPTYSFATVKLPKDVNHGRCLASISADNTRINIITENGKFYVYNLNTKSSNETEQLIGMALPHQPFGAQNEYL